MYTKNTKIVCTLGPSSDSVPEITRLFKAGMNVARLNFSHGTYPHHQKMIKNIRQIEKKYKKKIAILQDLQGPKIRLGELPKKGIELKKDDVFKLSTRQIEGYKKNDEIIIPIQYKGIVKDAKKGDTLLINDGLVEVKIEKKEKTFLLCRVKTDGIIKTRNGVALVTGSISSKTITKKDKKDLKFGLENNVDYVALSFVKSKKDIDDLRALIKKAKKETKIIAKIERHEAVRNLKQIIRAADGVMVARGDLGIDVPPEKVPIIQKRIISLANKYAKPVITATQVLQSMVKNPRPTRAEISDAANAVFDHTDAIMLSNESAVGKYPTRAVTVLTKVAITVEKELQKDQELMENLEAPHFLSSTNATCLNACELAKDLKADFIIVYTEDGYTARQIAKHRIYIPVITISPNRHVVRELTLVWGLNRIRRKKFKKKGTDKTANIVDFLKKEKLVKRGNKLVIICNASRQEKIISTFKI
jgi:pyruvate kinase